MMDRKLHPETALGAVKLKISDMERSLKFYEEITGFRLLRRNGRTAELAAAGGGALLVLEEVPNAIVTPPRGYSGLYHFAILLPSRKALGLSLRRLMDAGVHIGQADHLVSEALYISDPDGNGIEIYRDRPRQEWSYDANGYVRMATEPIDWDGLLKEAAGSEWAGLPEGTAIGHVHFHIGDLHRAKQFYCDTLGFDLEADWMRMGALFVGAGRYHHHVGLNVWAGNGAPPVPERGTGIDYFTIALPSAEELRRTAASLRQAGIEVREGGSGDYFLRDPFGIGIRLAQAED